MTSTTIKIQNLKCHGCANTIVTQLSKLDGVSDVEVNNDTDEVSFNHSSESGFNSAKAKLSELGYPAEGESNTFPTKAKSYISCAVGRVTK